MAITSKERSVLKGLANTRQPLIQVGKSGVTSELIEQLSILLENHELVKINILNNCNVDMGSVVETILYETGAEFVQQIGHKLTIYRRSKEPRIVLK
ncbi:MAG: YhbY family RNA-binding protein [Tissierellia bacterium]|nr:YhbY family RNA-binding protein [Tissierellia bacterium]